MSYTEMFAVVKNGDVVSIGDVHNAFRGAMFIWHKLAEKYFPGNNLMIDLGQEGSDFWKLINKDIPVHEKIVFGSTFDKVMVKSENIQRLIDAMDQFIKENPDGGNLDEQIRLLKSVIEDDDLIAVCWNQTSVCGSPWRRYIECEHCGNETDDLRSYNIHKDSGHWFLFEEFDFENNS